jgi:nucleoside-diphosphate-sugar epimerase
MGDARQIVHMAEAAYLASAAAGVRRLVWLSSASVNGQNPQPGTDETAPLHDRHGILYNNAKVRAEWILDRLARDGRVQVVKLRPSVVYGPRSRWVTDVAKDLQAGRAAWIEAGKAVCNAVSADNLVESIRLAATVPAAAGHSFLVRDMETVTWRELLLPIAAHLGFDAQAFAEIEPPVFAPERESWWAGITLTSAYAAVGRKVPDRIKRSIKAVAKAWQSPPSPVNPWRLPDGPKPSLSHEMSLLQQCGWVMPISKVERVLGYRPKVSFCDGMRQSLEWLDRAGWGRRLDNPTRFTMASL